MRDLNTSKNEEAFTLVELLVVILILGILASIMIPVLIGAVKKANDAAVASDIGSLVLLMEEMLIADPSADFVINYDVSGEGADEGFETDQLYINVDGNERVFFTSDEVYIDVSGDGGGYTIRAYHSNGSSYTSAEPFVQTR